MADPARKVVYSLSVSLDGYVAGPDGDPGWGITTEEIHRHHNARVRRAGTQLLGRGLYETMLVWETQDPAQDDATGEFAGIWQPLPKVVFSSTLTAVEGNARLAQGSPREELERLRSEPGGEIHVGGPGLGATFIRENLIDEYHMFVVPVLLGGGTPYFPPGVERELELIETKTFDPGVVLLRLRPASAG